MPESPRIAIFAVQTTIGDLTRKPKHDLNPTSLHPPRGPARRCTMEAPKLDKSRIAKNTLILYVRMAVLMAITLYTSRITLEGLGVEDFGVFNVVGGTIGMLSILTSALSAAISRFTTYELGKKDPDLSLVFSSSLSIQFGLSLIVIVVAETLGLWFINNELNLPPDSISSVNFIYQISILSFVLSLVTTPYTAQIVAYEKMSVFAWLSVGDVLSKLLISYLITTMPQTQRLDFYSGLWGVVGIIYFLIIKWYCNRQFKETKYHLVWNTRLLKQMFGFAGWNVIGSTAAILRDTGGNVLINIFFGPVVNAARGIAFQVNNAVSQFAGNFTMALNPQITKSYAMGETAYTNSLVSQGARFSYYLLLLLSLPVILNTPYILGWWLKEVPDGAIVFVRLTLIFGLVETLSRPLITLMLATGRIMWYQIVVGGAQLLNLPLAYIWLLCGGGPEIILIVAIATSILCLILRLTMLKRMIGFKVMNYCNDVVKRIVIVSGISIIPFTLLSFVEVTSFIGLLVQSALVFVWTAIVAYALGCSKREREVVNSKMRQLFGKLTLVRQ